MGTDTPMGTGESFARAGELGDSYALILNSQLPQEIPFEIVKKYPGSTFIVRFLATAAQKSYTVKPLRAQN